MKKTITKIFAGLLCVVLCAGMLCGLCGCSNPMPVGTNINGAAFNKDNAFEKVAAFEERVNVTDNTYEYYTYTYFRETNTDIMYVLCEQFVNRHLSTTGFTVMLNTDGTPLLYSEWVEMGK